VRVDPRRLNMPLTILHLSDAHFGRPRDKFKSAEVLKPLLIDLDVMRKEHGTPGLIIFSGDLAYGEIPQSHLTEQYEEAARWIGEAYAALQTEPAKTPLLLVPGNHDVNRKVILTETTLFLTKSAEACFVENAMQEGGIEFTTWLGRQAEWQAFARDLCRSSNVQLDEQLNCTHLLTEADDQRIGIVGLNTSWSSHDNGEKGRLWFGAHQLQKAYALVSECDVRILVTHHPIGWMNGKEQRLEQRIEQDYHIHFQGHEHSAWYALADRHLRVDGGACYADSTDERTYAWLKLDLKRRSAGLWLREFTDKADRTWKAAHYPPKTDADGYADVSALLQPASKTTSQSPRHKPKRLKNAPTNSPRVSQTPNITAVETAGELATVLQSKYSFVWESEDHKNSPPDSTVVYWPVRLREPTAIHAVQAFAAGGLMKKGARVILCIDDLGTPDLPTEVLEKALAKYISKVGASWTDVQVRYFTTLVTDESFAEASLLMRQWLADLNYKLTDVFEIAKILEPNKREIDNTKKPRRLFTPPLVWFCFIQMIKEFQANVTLGGYDERRLWEAWRRVTKKRYAVGHLYIPELKEPGRTTHMSDTRLRLQWDGLQDIERALRDVITDEQPLAEGRLLPWAFLGCLQLPCHLTGTAGGISVDGKAIESVRDLDGVDLSSIVKPLAERIENWMI